MIDPFQYLIPSVTRDAAPVQAGVHWRAPRFRQSAFAPLVAAP
jgi:hypothetical protein